MNVGNNRGLYYQMGDMLGEEQADFWGVEAI